MLLVGPCRRPACCRVARSSAPGEQRQRGGSKTSETPLAAAIAVPWPVRPNPVTSVHALTTSAASARSTCAASRFSRRIDAVAAVELILGRAALLGGRRDDAGAERLGEEQFVAGPRARVRQHARSGSISPVIA